MGFAKELSSEFCKPISRHKPRSRHLKRLGRRAGVAEIDIMDLSGSWLRGLRLPIGPYVVPFCGLYLESYKVIPKGDYLGAYG